MAMFLNLATVLVLEEQLFEKNTESVQQSQLLSPADIKSITFRAHGSENLLVRPHVTLL